MSLGWIYSQFAIVDYFPGEGFLAIGKLPSRGGVNQADAVQIVTELAVLRDAVVQAPLDLLVYDKEGDPMMRTVTTLEKARKLTSEGATTIDVAGDVQWLGGSEWGNQLALALDNVMLRMGEARVGGEEPQPSIPGEGQAVTVGMSAADLAPQLAWIPVAQLLVAVAGAALSVIGTAAVWRYLDPELQTNIAAIAAAGKSYAERLETFKSTGTMPPPSIIEDQAAKIVKANADERRTDAWVLGGGIAGGIAAGSVLLAVVRRAMG